MVKVLQNTVIPNTSNYDVFQAMLPRYRFSQTFISNIPATTVLLGTTSVVRVQFRVPGGTVFNPARSVIPVQYQIPAFASNYGVAFQNICPFQYISFGEAGGNLIAEIQFANHVVNATRPGRTSLTEFMTHDVVDDCYPCNSTFANNPVPYSLDGTVSGTLNATSVNGNEIQYLKIGSAVNTAVNVTFQWPLNAVRDSFFSMDKDFIFGQDMYLNLDTCPAQQLYGYTTNPANILNSNWTVPTTSAQTASFLNLTLQLALQKNYTLAELLRNDLRNGTLKISFPWLSIQRTPISQTTSSTSILYNFDQGYGRKLKRIYFTCYNANENSNYCYDRSNWNGTKIQNIYSRMDSSTLTDSALNCFNPNYLNINPGAQWSATFGGVLNYMDDYRESIKTLRGSVIQNAPMFMTNWGLEQSWGQPDFLLDCKQEIPDDNIDDGFSTLDGQHQFTNQLTLTFPASGNSNCGSGLLAYYIATFIRTLHNSWGGYVISA